MSAPRWLSPGRTIMGHALGDAHRARQHLRMLPARDSIRWTWPPGGRCSEMCLTARFAIMPSSPSRPLDAGASIASASITGRPMPVRITDRASQISPVAPITSTWFTNGLVRKGLFYARSVRRRPHFLGAHAGRPARPQSFASLSLVAAKGALWLAWKEFDGEKTTVPVMISHDNGRTWSTPECRRRDFRCVGSSVVGDRMASGCFCHGRRKATGYRFMPLEDAP